MYAENAPPVDPYADDYTAPPPLPADAAPPRGRSRSRSPPPRNGAPRDGYRSPYRRRSPPPARRPAHTPVQAPNPSNVLGVFGLSIRTQERDLDEEFSRFGRVEKVTIVYDQRQSDRSRGFGFIKMATVEDATRCIQELNGVDLNGRRGGGGGGGGGRDSYRDSYRDRDYGRRDRDRDPYGRDNRDSRDWRERRSPPPSRGGRYSPDRRRRSYSRSPPRGGSPRRDYDAPAAAPVAAPPADARW
ncbi:hypothetical protein B0H14DRAFT_2720496 [Mycena olivaceomarginata]|nr:hypothetical protein B0H14DRAFT_2720496 [Mycena olivaceomarginata]